MAMIERAGMNRISQFMLQHGYSQSTIVQETPPSLDKRSFSALACEPGSQEQSAIIRELDDHDRHYFKNVD